MSKSTKLVLGVIAVVLVVWLITTSNRKSPVAEQAIKIGVIVPLSGPFAFYGEDMRRGVMDAVGSSTAVKLIIEDEKCEPKDAVSAFQKLTNVDKVKFVIGPGCGSPQEAIAPLLKGSDVVVMLSAAASSDLFMKSGGNMFNDQYSLQNESKYMANKIYDLGYKKAALLTYQNEFSKTHATSFRQNYKGQIAMASELLDYSASPLSELTKIKASGADALYVPDASFFFGGGPDKMKQIGLDIPVFASYSSELQPLLPLTHGVRYSFPEGIGNDVGAIYGVAKDATDAFVPVILSCKGDVGCVRKALNSSGKFDESGVSNRGIILKQNVGGKPTLIKS